MLCECAKLDWPAEIRHLEHHPDCKHAQPAEKPLGCGSWIDGVWKHCIYRPWHKEPHKYVEEH